MCLNCTKYYSQGTIYKLSWLFGTIIAVLIIMLIIHSIPRSNGKTTSVPVNNVSETETCRYRQRRNQYNNVAETRISGKKNITCTARMVDQIERISKKMREQYEKSKSRISSCQRKHQLLTLNLRDRTISFIDKSDAQIFFESFKDKSERVKLFHAQTWTKFYQECSGSNDKIKRRLNNENFGIKFDATNQNIEEIHLKVGFSKIKSLNIKDFEYLSHLRHLELREGLFLE